MNVPKIKNRSTSGTSGSRNGCALVPDKGLQRFSPQKVFTVKSLLFNLLFVGDLVGLIGCTWTLRLRESDAGESSLLISETDLMRLLSDGGEDCGVVGTD